VLPSDFFYAIMLLDIAGAKQSDNCAEAQACIVAL
jgi:hypothetical protein